MPISAQSVVRKAFKYVSKVELRKKLGLLMSPLDLVATKGLLSPTKRLDFHYKDP